MPCDPIYLDYNATTPVRPEAVEALLPLLRSDFGNPSSSHFFGIAPARAVHQARVRVAALLHASPDEIVFTGSGTEADNLAVFGAAEARKEEGDHIITTQIEHPAVLLACRHLETRGFRVTYLPVDGDGRVRPSDVAGAINSATILISVMYANNETGVLQPLEEVGAIARENGILFHTDAAQAVGKVPVDVDSLQVDLLTVAGHKFYAPKGVGALYVRRGVAIAPLLHGGGQERGLRPGTENVPLIAALGRAAELAGEEMDAAMGRLSRLRDRLHELLLRHLPDRVRLNGHQSERLPGTLNVSFDGIAAAALLAATPEIAASTGSACHAGSGEPSPVLTAMGVPADRALAAVRLSVGIYTTDHDIEQAARALAASAQRLRA